MIIAIRQHLRTVVAFCLFVFLQMYSMEVYALTSGPSQQEYASFEPVGTTDMVNLYTGDFTYNIPLLSVPGPNGGYPINLAYHSGIGMDQEASWVGLGWNVNVGSVNRSLRGLPDDFKNEEIIHQRHMRPSTSGSINLFQQDTENVGVSGGGKKGTSIKNSTTLQVYYNNYKGLGYRIRTSTSFTKKESKAVGLNLDFSYDPHGGIDVGLSLKVDSEFNKGTKTSLGVSGAYNSRQGMQNIAVSGSIGHPYEKQEAKNVLGAMLEAYKARYSTGAGGVTFGFSHGTPATTLPMQTIMQTNNLKMGFDTETTTTPGEFASSFPFNCTITTTESRVRGNGVPRTFRGYGYMYNKEGMQDQSALRDFSFNPVAYNRNIPFLPPSSVTNDVFGVTGQGMSGVFKVYHSDMGVFYPTRVVSTTQQYQISIDVGVEPAPAAPLSCALDYHLGIGGVPPLIGVATNTTGKWTSGANGLYSQFDFGTNYGKAAKVVSFDRTFFKDMGDRPAIRSSNTTYDTWGGESPIFRDFYFNALTGVSQGSFINNGNNMNVNSAINQTSSAPRTRVIQALTKEQSLAYGMTSGYEYYVKDITDSDNDGQTDDYIGISKYNANQSADHISEVSILEPDGMRYIYGLPAYNISQEDASFSVAKTGVEIPSDAYVGVPEGPGYDQAGGETSRKPEFLDKKILPPYAHSWMLTSVVSSDYVDITGDGVTSDDLGYWVDFKYEKTSDAYNWRAPYRDAIYMPGTNQDFDDKGSYSKGQKELFYLKEIRTKTHVAIFELENRNDGIAASAGVDGGLPSSIQDNDRMQLLRRMKLYTVNEYDKNQENAVPLKVVHFEYKHDNNSTKSEELCQGILNSAVNGGKLTLHKVWFTYQNSNRGQSSPYVFHYGFNPNYSLKNNDCWGNYKNNNVDSLYPYHEFPYADQSDNYKVPWHLNQIDLPTGSSMHIDYEQDDYAYVEDHKAMELYEIVSLGKEYIRGSKDLKNRRNSSSATGVSLLNKGIHTDANSNELNPDWEYRVYFPLKKAVTTAELNAAGYDVNTNSNAAHDWFRDHYIGKTEDIFFKAKVKLLAASNIKRNDSRTDFVSGYAKIRTETVGTHYGVENSTGASGSYDVGYITLEKSVIKAGLVDDHIHPFRNAAFQHLRNVRSELVFGSESGAGVGRLFSIIPDMIEMMAGYKYAYKLNGFCDQIFLDGFSQIRLLSPEGKKKGGGCRVREVHITDNWNDMTTADYENSTYGQVYDYTIEENGKRISSGVAYEPFAGKEQNPMVKPSYYNPNKPIGLNTDEYFMEEPIMMAHYPSPSVGYRKVTVESLTAKDVTGKRTTTPITEYEFYTPKEFPIIFKRTDLEKMGPRFKIIPIPGVYTKFKRYEAASQGYSLIFNDMAGKPRSITQKTYPIDTPTKNYPGTVISKQEYEYYTDENGNLDNNVDVFTEDGKYEKAKLGVEVDIQMEASENVEASENFTLDLNMMSGLITTPAGPVCIPFPMVASGGISSTGSSLKTMITQKFIHKKGILKSTTVTNQSSTIKTENLVFDALTSDPLLTRTTNEFNDDLYAYTQKAYWHYDGMDAAFKNVGITVQGPMPKNADGMYVATTIVNNENVFPFTDGDEVYVKEYGGNKFKAVVYATSKTSTGGLIGLARMDDGSKITEYNILQEVTITRSGRRNLLTAPAGNIVSKNLAYETGAFRGDKKELVFNEQSGVLNATAVKYRDFWPSEKVCDILPECIGTYCLDGALYGFSNIDSPKVELDYFLKNDLVRVEVDGQSIPAEQIMLDDVICGTSNITMCARTQRPYRVEFVPDDSTNAQILVQNTNYTANAGGCSFAGTDIPLNCNDVFSQVGVTIDGCQWPNNKQPVVNCGDYIVGTFERKINDHITFLGKTMPCLVVHPPNGSIHLNLWLNGVSLTGGWVGPDNTSNTFLNGFATVIDLANYLNTYASTIAGVNLNWQYTSTIPELLYVVIPNQAQANLLNGLQLQLAEREFLTGAFFATPCLNGNNYDTYDFVTDVNALLKKTVLDVPSWAQTINGSPISTHYTGLRDDKTITCDELNITLPSNQKGTIRIVQDCGNIDQIIAVHPFDTRGESIQISFPFLGAGPNNVVVYKKDRDPDDSNKEYIPIDNFTVSCNQDNQIGRKKAICSPIDGTITYVDAADIKGYYNNGTKGSWRPWTSYTYVTDRDYTQAALRDKGVFTKFTPFDWKGANEYEWQHAGLATRMDGHGYQLESVDAIGNYSAALYDYNNNLPVAVAKNARYQEVLFDGFENYPKDCSSHWEGFEAANVVVSPAASHSGVAGYKVAASQASTIVSVKLGGIDEKACAKVLGSQGYSEVDVLKFLKEGVEVEGMNIPQVMLSSTKSTNGSYAAELPQACNCLGKFAPSPDKKYTFSAWVKRNQTVYDNIRYESLSLNVRFRDAAGNIIGNPLGTALAPKGSMIDHWQRISDDITIPKYAVEMELFVFNFGQEAYIDDLRIHPSDAQIMTYVYDKGSLRNTAVLDDNNYTTFYIYDEKGQLEKTKKETTEGIKTINEGRQHVKRNTN